MMTKSSTPLKLALAVHRHGEGAWVAAASFEEWGAMEPTRTYMTRIEQLPDKPARGAPDLRDVACLVKLLQEHKLEPDTLVIDAAVHVDTADTPGLGRHLHDALGGRVAVIGVSTKTQPDMPAQYEVYREEEARPVIVTCVGVDLGAAKVRVRTMHGKRRAPTLLKLVARMAKSAAE